MTDTINDITLNEDPSVLLKIDARSFFPRIDLNIISHNNARAFHDIQFGKGKILDLTKRHILIIKKPSKTNLEDLYNRKKYTSNFLQIFSKQRIIRTNPLSLLSTLPTIQFNSLDIRALEEIPSGKLYPDIYNFPLPLSRHIKKTLRKNRKRIAVGGIVFASVSLSFVFLSLSAKAYIESETIRNYNRIAALRDMRDLEVVSREIASIENSFNQITILFSPFRFLLDNGFYSHPEVRLASNVIYG